MRAFIAGLATETNTFAPFPTGARGFERGDFFHGNASKGHGFLSPLARLWREAFEAEGDTVVEGLVAFAEPGGTTLRNVYEAYRSEILSGLEAAKPIDIVMLILHGAMVAHGYDDCEGDLLASVRDVVGAHCIIAAELDLHGHLTERMRSNANMLVMYKQYPHIDIIDRGNELFAFARAAALKKIKPVSAVFDCQMIGIYPTARQPMATFVSRLQSAEKRPRVLSVSFCHGFPWADVADVGSKVLVYTDNDADLSQNLARGLGEAIYRERKTLMPDIVTIDEGLDLAADTDGLVVIAETYDNPGGGAPGDCTLLLRRILGRKMTKVAFGCLWDPCAVDACFEAGEGAVFDLRLGGKAGIASGDPLDLRIRVMALAERHRQSGLTGPVELGRSVWLTAQGVNIVVSSVRTQTLAPDAFTGLGVELSGCHLVVVKSIQHFHVKFAPIARKVIYVSGAGALDMNFAALPYTKRSLGYWPRVDDPLGLDR